MRIPSPQTEHLVCRGCNQQFTPRADQFGRVQEWQPHQCHACYSNGGPFPAVLAELGLGRLYHITTIANLAGIARQGLLPRARLTAGAFSDIAYPDALGLRSRYPLSLGDGTRIQPEQMVPLFFAAKNPMTFRRRNHPDRCMVVINVVKLFQQDVAVVFSDGNLASGSRKTSIYHQPRDLSHLNIALLKAQYWTDPGLDEQANKERKRQRAAELLVSPTIGPSAIDHVAVPTHVNLAGAQERMSEDAAIPVRVDATLFP